MKNPKPPQPTTTSTSGTTEATKDEKQILEDMGRVDQARATQDSKNPIDQAIDGEAANVANVEPVADPALVSTLTMLVSTSVNVLHDKYKWTEPDDAWKTQVATLGALLIDRYLPGILKTQGEIVALTLMIGVYAVENIVRFQSASTSDSDPGVEGKRKDDFVEPAPFFDLQSAAHPA